jgi:hypothetical protein
MCATSGNFARCDATSASQAASLSSSVGISRVATLTRPGAST